MEKPVVVLADGYLSPVALEDECILPSQIAPGPTDSGERQLMRAVLEMALRDLCLPPENEWHQDARDWVESYDRNWFFSFENLCDTLGLHAESVRRAIRARANTIQQRLPRRWAGNGGGAV